jgi:hypothetical protein
MLFCRHADHATKSAIGLSITEKNSSMAQIADERGRQAELAAFSD